MTTPAPSTLRPLANAVSAIREPARVVQSLARLSFGATIILIPFRYRNLLVSRPVGNIYGDYTDFLLFASDIALALTLALWVAAKLLAREPFKRGPAFVTLPIVTLTAASAISVAASVDPPLSIYHAIRLALLAGLAFYVVDQIHSPDQITIPVAIQVIVQALVGIGQFLRQADLGLQRLGEYPLNPAWNGVSIVMDGGQRWLRAYGLADHPNILGGSLAFGLLLILGHTLRTRENRRIFFFSVFVLGCAALFATFSRASWLAFGAGAIFLTVFLIRRRDLLLRGAVLLAATLLILAPLAVSHADLVSVRLPFTAASAQTPVEQQSIGERELLNDVTSQVFEVHALLGVGSGALPEALRQQFPDFPFYYQPAHFTLLDAAAELGLFGAAIYAALLTAPWIAFALRPALRTSLPALTVSAALLAVTMVGFFDYYTWLLAPGRLWQYMIWGLWAATYQSVSGESDDR